MELKGQPAIITGGASGLGGATAEALAAAGAKVAIWDLNEEQGQEHAAKLGGVFCKVNVSDEESVKSALVATTQEIGAPRILINCAGIAIGEKTVGKKGPHVLDNFSKVINVNLVGSFNCIRLFAEQAQNLEPLNEDGERGVIINTASVAAYEGQMGQAAYSASKGGVVAMTLPIARDLMNAGIRCNTIAPGTFFTPMMMGMDQKVIDGLGAMVPFPKRLGKPSEYASMAIEICRNTMMNGETVRIDGAIRMQPR